MPQSDALLIEIMKLLQDLNDNTSRLQEQVELLALECEGQRMRLDDLISNAFPDSLLDRHKLDHEKFYRGGLFKRFLRWMNSVI